MLHGQGDALAIVVDVEYADPHSVADLDDLVGVFDEVVGELADVDQAIAVDPHIHEGSKGRDVRDRTLEDHVFPKVLGFPHVVSEAHGGEVGSGIATRLADLVHDVVQRVGPHVLTPVALDVNAGYQGLVPHQLLERHTQVATQLLDELVAFRMNGGVVEGIAASDPQKACGLLEGLGSKSGTFRSSRREENEPFFSR